MRKIPANKPKQRGQSIGNVIGDKTQTNISKAINAIPTKGGNKTNNQAKKLFILPI